MAAIHPFYTSVFREFTAAGRPIIGSAPVGRDGTAAWLEAIGEACGAPATKVAAVKNAMIGAIEGALAGSKISGRITLSGYEGSELLVGSASRRKWRRRSLRRAARVQRRRTPTHDREWLESRGVLVNFRASLEDDLAALNEYEPDLAIGTTPIVQKAKQRSIPALYFTNLISARPLMGPAGAGSLAQVINGAIANKTRFDAMTEFFEGVGTGHAAGVWETTPEDRPEFRKRAVKKARSEREEPIGC